MVQHKSSAVSHISNLLSVSVNDVVATALSEAQVFGDIEPEPQPEDQISNQTGESDEQSNDFIYIQENEEGDWRPVAAQE